LACWNFLRDRVHGRNNENVQVSLVNAQEALNLSADDRGPILLSAGLPACCINHELVQGEKSSELERSASQRRVTP
jgi:hypothetical protein